MAAHSVTILREMWKDMPATQSGVDEFVPRYQSALNYAPGMDLIDFDDWVQLGYALDRFKDTQGYWWRAKRELQELVLRIFKTQLREWYRLGKPYCYEDWVDARH